MTIQEILEAHLNWYFPYESSNETRCLCGQVISVGDGAQKLRMGEQAAFAHAAEVLDKHMQEREAAVIAGLAELLDEYRSNHDIAECAAPVEGETGRQAIIDNWESIIEEPAEWLRGKSKEHHENGFEHLRYVAYEAWYAGKESDPDEENPYADEEASNGR